jgi:hypothetical protein
VNGDLPNKNLPLLRKKSPAAPNPIRTLYVKPLSL